MPAFYDDTAEPQTEGDVHFYGGLNDDILNREVTLSYGHSRQEKAWKPITCTVAQFILNHSTFQEGPKDGSCILQGEAVDGVRNKNTIKQLDVLMMDHDTGVTIQDYCEQAEANGIWTLIWTTHSHGKGLSTIRFNEFTSRKHDNKYKVKAKSELTEDIVRAYLLEVRGYLPEIVAELAFEIKQTGDGEVVEVQHAPMDKFRSMRILNKPYDIANHPVSVAEASQGWASVIRAVSDHLKSPQYDTSCTDVSRLMYLPRKPRKSTVDHRIIVINGDFLDLDDIPMGKSVADVADKFKALGGSSQKFETPNLLTFMAKHGAMFDAANWLLEVGEKDVKNERPEGGIHFTCPNEDGHSKPETDDVCCMVTNGSEGDGFTALCRHQGCEQMSGKDRVWYIDRWCKLYNIEDAMELTQWVTDYEAPEPAKETPATDMMGQLQADIEAAIKRDDDLEMACLPTTLSLTYKGVGPQAINRIIKASQKTAAQEKKKAFDINEWDGPVMSSFDAEEQLTVLLRHINRLCRADHDPRVFKKEEGFSVRLTEDEESSAGYQLIPMDRSQWNAWLRDNVGFFKEAKEDEEPRAAPPFEDLVNYCTALSPRMKLEELDRVTTIPVFAKDGTIRIAPGYCKKTRNYVRTIHDFELKPVPKIPSPKEVNQALGLLFNDMLVGFPFSDAFEGEEKEAIWNDRENLKLNWNRGRSSRANALAMFLQPMMRGMIDGPTPAYMVDKPIASTGATTMVELIGLLMDNKPTKATPFNTSNEEQRKKITSALISGRSIIFFDNLNQKLDSGDLASLLTSGEWSDRILGESREVTLSVKSQFVMTGNRAEMSGELVRRFCPVKLYFPGTQQEIMDRGVADFVHKDISARVKERRALYIWALQTLIRNWIAKGQVKGEYYLASYASWAETIGGVLDAAGVTGFLGTQKTWANAKNRETSYAESVTEVLLREDIVEIDKPFQVSEVIEMEYPEDGASSFINMPMPEERTLRFRSKTEATTQLGKYWGSRMDQQFVTYTPDATQPHKTQRLVWVKVGKSHSATLWMLKGIK